ncbi:MAG: DUF305 domain-containing protein [Cellvibrionaceae bacterium]
MHMSYWRFAAMIATSTVAMFGLMYLNTYVFEHVMWSETRLWMAFVMGATMAVIMLSYMLNMYQNKAINIGIFAASVVVFGLALWLVRSQTTINQVEYMKAMVPHHSIAIMTSERAYISDPRARKLADEIIEAQRREIAEMKFLIDELENSEAATTAAADEKPAELLPAAEVINTADITRTDPATMEEMDISKVVATDQRCTFAYTAAGQAIFAAGPSADNDALRGVLKLHGNLLQLDAQTANSFEDLAGGASFTANLVRVEVTPLPGEEPIGENGEQHWPADLRFRLEQGAHVGYRGWYRCRGEGM